MPETTGFVVQGRKPPNRENASAHFFALRANFYILRSRLALPMGPKPKGVHTCGFPTGKNIEVEPKIRRWYQNDSSDPPPIFLVGPNLGLVYGIADARHGDHGLPRNRQSASAQL